VNAAVLVPSSALRALRAVGKPSESGSVLDLSTWAASRRGHVARSDTIGEVGSVLESVAPQLPCRDVYSRVVTCESSVDGHSCVVSARPYHRRGKAIEWARCAAGCGLEIRSTEGLTPCRLGRSMSMTSCNETTVTRSCHYQSWPPAASVGTRVARGTSAGAICGSVRMQHRIRMFAAYSS